MMMMIVLFGFGMIFELPQKVVLAQRL